MVQRANPTTLGPSLYALAEAKEQHARMLALHHLLMQLWHHHTSIAKGAGPSSRDYNLELSQAIAYHLGFRDTPPSSNRSGGTYG